MVSDMIPPDAPPAASRIATAKAMQMPFARGDRSSWSLTDGAAGLSLRIGAEPAVPFGKGVWRTTLQGRELTAVARDGRSLRLQVGQAICICTGDPGARPEGIRAVLIVDGRRLPGCLLTAGRPPYPGR